jgi:hypothetical protein
LQLGLQRPSRSANPALHHNKWNLKVRKTLIIATAIGIGAAIPAMAHDERPWEKWESIVWTASCETFQTPHHVGFTTCDGAEAEFTIIKLFNDGSADISFKYAPGLGKDSWEAITFTTGPTSAQDFYPITEVEDEVSNGPVKTYGACRISGRTLRCVSGGGDNKITIVYHLISLKEHLLCSGQDGNGDTDTACFDDIPAAEARAAAANPRAH